MDPLIVISDEIERANNQAADYEEKIKLFRVHHPAYSEDIRYQQLLAEKMEVLRSVTKMRRRLTKRAIEISEQGMAIYSIQRDERTQYFVDMASLAPQAAPPQPAEAGVEESKLNKTQTKLPHSQTPASVPSPVTSPHSSHLPTAMASAEELEMPAVIVDLTSASHTAPHTPPPMLSSLPAAPKHMPQQLMQPPQHVHQLPAQVSQRAVPPSAVPHPPQNSLHLPNSNSNAPFQFAQAAHMQQLQSMHNNPPQHQSTQMQPPPHSHPSHIPPPQHQPPPSQPQQLQIEQYTAAKSQIAGIMRDHSELRIYFVGLDGHMIAAPEHQMIRRRIKRGEDPAQHMRGEYRSYPVSYVKRSNTFVHNSLFFPKFHPY